MILRTKESTPLYLGNKNYFSGSHEISNRKQTCLPFKRCYVLLASLSREHLPRFLRFRINVGGI